MALDDVKIDEVAAQLLAHARAVDDATIVDAEEILGGALHRQVPPLPPELRTALVNVIRSLEAYNVETRDLHEIDDTAPSAKRLRTATRVLADLAERARNKSL